MHLEKHTPLSVLTNTTLSSLAIHELSPIIQVERSQLYKLGTSCHATPSYRKPLFNPHMSCVCICLSITPSLTESSISQQQQQVSPRVYHGMHRPHYSALGDHSLYLFLLHVAFSPITMHDLPSLTQRNLEKMKMQTIDDIIIFKLYLFIQVLQTYNIVMNIWIQFVLKILNYLCTDSFKHANIHFRFAIYNRFDFARKKCSTQFLLSTNNFAT